MYRGTTSGGENPTPIATGIVGTTFTNTGLTVGTTYFYVVTAVNGALQSVHSNEASASPNFTDTFHRANSTNLGSNWTTFIGQMGISSNMAAGHPAVVDLAQVNGISLTNAAVSALVNVGTTGERYAGVFARRDASGNMYVAMLGVNSAGNPAGFAHRGAALPLHPWAGRDRQWRLELPHLHSSCSRRPTPAAPTWGWM